jgi:hypothetical protein
VDPSDLENYLLSPKQWFSYDLPDMAEGILRQHLKAPNGSMALGYIEQGFFILGFSQQTFLIWSEWQ